MTNTFSLSFNKTVIASAILHASFFAAALVLSGKTIQPRPLGVELAYNAVPIPPQVSPAVQQRPAKTQRVSPPLMKKEELRQQNPEIPTTVSPAAVSPVGSAAQSGTLSGREGVSNGSEVSPEDRYLYELKKLLERRKSYPILARKMGHAGTVMMRFTLKADGTLAESEVVAKAPYETLNQAATSLVQGINGLKPFPQEIKKDSWSITVPIEYTLN